jgi:hypothetical protein
MSALFTLSEERVAEEQRRYEEIRWQEERWRREWRRRFTWLVVRCSVVYGIGGVLSWGSMAMVGDSAPIAFWGGLLLSSAGPAGFGYAFWMREQGLWG